MSQSLYRLPVKSGTASSQGYEIVVGSGIWQSLPALVENACPAHRYAVITDDRVAELYGTRMLRAMHAAGHRTDIFAFPAGEEQKTRETWIAVTDAMLEAGLGRDSAVIVLGGGVPGDLGAFVAATYMRGLPVVQVPTTLLAMIDASVGGKTGVNTAAGKNLVGAFWPPRIVVVDPVLLATLPTAERRSGLAEAVKHAAIGDGQYLESIRQRSDDLVEAEPEAICELVVRSVEIKAEFVSSDEREAGPRKALNFGHTVAHALETASAYRLNHGEAVAIGMVMEARIGERFGVTEPSVAGALREVLSMLELPTSVPRDIPVEQILHLIRADKKRRSGRTQYTLLRRIGTVDTASARWTHAVPDEVVREAFSETR